MDQYDFDVVTTPECEPPGKYAVNKPRAAQIEINTGNSQANVLDMTIINAVNTLAQHASPPTKTQYKYAEDRIIADFQAYIDQTYNQHYKATPKVECFDAWIAMGDATPTFRNTAMKYLWRYGRKTSYVESKNDLFKALHYTLMCLYNDHYNKDK